MTSDVLRKKFIEFFVQKGHKEIPSASLVPENDPTVLFTTAGMHSLVPYLMSQSHPLGKRLCSVQKCLRTDDIEEVGDMRHFTFFEMLGNWSLGDYFKKESIEWSFEFLTGRKWLGLDSKKLYVSVFEGDSDASKDNKSIKYWQETFAGAGIKAEVGDWKKPTYKKNILQERIFMYGKKENWWGPAGQTGPCGPDSEIFYDTGLAHSKNFGKICHINCNCGRFLEIWNNVFMEFNKKTDGTFKLLKQKNVDTGMGLERIVALTEFIDGKIARPDPFLTELFSSMIRIIELESGKKYKDHTKEFRIISDHLKAAIFLAADKVEPSNKDKGYVLRRLIRRAAFKIQQLKKDISVKETVSKICHGFINSYSDAYPELGRVNTGAIIQEIEKFAKILNKGVRFLEKTAEINGKIAFNLFQSYGIPLDLTYDLAVHRGQKIDKKEFDKEFKKHQEISRAGAKQKFTGGLQDNSDKTTKLHTATHLLHESLRRVLGKHVQQVGSQITQERLRFDFTHPKKLTEKEIKEIENMVNKQISRNLPVKFEIMSLEEAQKQEALAFFGQKYPEKIKVYSIGDFSKEVCGGPHLDFTGKLEVFKIIKEKAVGTGKRRIYAKVEE